MVPHDSTGATLELYVDSSPSNDSKEWEVVDGMTPELVFDMSLEFSKIFEYGDITGDVGDEIHGCLSSLFVWRLDCWRKNLLVAAAIAAAAAAAAFSARMPDPEKVI